MVNFVHFLTAKQKKISTNWPRFLTFNLNLQGKFCDLELHASTNEEVTT